MIDIIFKGKRKDNGEWVYGYLIISDERTFICLTPECLTSLYFLKEYSFTGFIEVIPETVGQYTGLTDKNGTKIFEGDIIKFCRGLKKAYFVEWDSGRFVITRKDAHGEIIEVSICPCEVIGNIHDNPELLEVEG